MAGGIPGISEALNDGNDLADAEVATSMFADAEVATSMFKRAIGYPSVTVMPMR